MHKQQKTETISQHLPLCKKCPLRYSVLQPKHPKSGESVIYSYLANDDKEFHYTREAKNAEDFRVKIDLTAQQVKDQYPLFFAAVQQCVQPVVEHIEDSSWLGKKLHLKDTLVICGAMEQILPERQESAQQKYFESNPDQLRLL